jgi:signal transduction histidine kinase/ActR/RegA family two-component response regulator
MNWISDFLEAGRRLAPHGYCLLWDPRLVWTHVISDGLIAAAYFSIPVALVSFVRRRKDVEFSWILWLFALFIVACGTTHLLSIWTLWNADYGLEAAVKLVTAIASVTTAIVLWPLLPRLLAIPSPNQLAEKNAHLEIALGQLTREVAERKRAESALQQAHKMEAVGQLTGGLAHDFNNLLQSISGSFALIAKSPNSEKVTRWAELGAQAANKGARLTAQLLAFSRAQKLELKPIRVAPMLRDMHELLATAVGKQARIEMDLDAADSFYVVGDATQIELAVMNLVINARDAMPSGGVVRIRAIPEELSGDPELADGRFLRIVVEDNGVGMSADVLARAFDPFFTTKSVGKGTGLGLSMVYGVARQSGGRAEIASKPGEGARVSILLPEAVGQAEEAPDALVAPSGPACFRILVVDDDPDVRLMTVSMLEDLGHRVASADSGKDALHLLRGELPDLLLIDFVMPEMNGAELARAVRARGVDVPIIFATGFAESAAIETALGEAPVVLRKPFDQGSLSSLVAQACAGRQAVPTR